MDGNLTAGILSPSQHLRDPTNGAPETSLQHRGPKVYGVVQRTGSDRQQELMAREWTVSHLQDEMKYIREVSRLDAPFQRLW